MQYAGGQSLEMLLQTPRPLGFGARCDLERSLQTYARNIATLTFDGFSRIDVDTARIGLKVRVTSGWSLSHLPPRILQEETALSDITLMQGG
jgi:hypothetical protein